MLNLNVQCVSYITTPFQAATAMQVVLQGRLCETSCLAIAGGCVMILWLILKECVYDNDYSICRV